MAGNIFIFFDTFYFLRQSSISCTYLKYYHVSNDRRPRMFEYSDIGIFFSLNNDDVRDDNINRRNVRT